MKDANTVLIVVDDQGRAEALTKAVRAAGFGRVLACTTYEQTLRAISENTLRACVLDINLGDRFATSPQFREAGRRVLAILFGHRCRVLVWTDADVSLAALRALHPGVELADHGARPDQIVAHLLRRNTH